MKVELNAEQEQIIREQPKVFQPDAVKRMIEFAENKAVKLPPGERVKDFIHEGHRF